MNHRLSLNEVRAFEAEVRQESMAMLHALGNGGEAARSAAPAVVASAERSPSLEEASLKQNNILFPRGSDEHSIDDYQVGEGDTLVWRVKANLFSSGVCEVRASLGNVWTHRRGKSSSESSTVVESISEQRIQQRFESNIQRAKKTLRARCLELDADHMLTLTKRGKFQSLDDLWRSFKEFNRLMSLRFKEWRYVAVPELHADGATYHMHVAIKGFYWAPAVRRIWQKSLGGTGNERGETTLGNVDIKSFRGRACAARVRRIAGYISKYVAKGFAACNVGRRLFASSRGLHPHRVERGVCRHWTGIRELVLAVQGHVARLGSTGIGTCYFWSRERRDGSPINMGFVLTTDWKGAIA